MSNDTFNGVLTFFSKQDFSFEACRHGYLPLAKSDLCGDGHMANPVEISDIHLTSSVEIFT